MACHSAAVDELSRRGDERDVGTQRAQSAVDGHDARDNSTTSVGRRMPNRDSVATRSCITAGSTEPPGSHVLGQQTGERPLELIGRRGVGQVDDPLDAVAEHVHVATRDRHHDVGDRRLLDRIETADRAEVDQSERSVGEREDVARMRIGVEQTTVHDLIQRGAEQLIGEALPIELRVLPIARRRA